ncbi:hypothetical protein FSU_0441 [Fibrobacter succinogenes subsp. succinogenes S85]|jgi:fatty-acid desaturase|uniref:Uncharacterized protein n=1 Tax=Fibrobacter succinogenes (strain ATCC 19169 / S85) TaxID=59374 RepID=C9RJ18_FIBSS|nr:hypothetical protein [Fibrobacter succinogenes]ACX73662.1 hypothetical protein Fisuc_0047 [Fibrobacter succinogenes subsp. succinogenes S85]ADL25150.1 hypothetical protein FSU_0441 [Fibrobacter succinogenes subsp. succinogenes S85]
MSDYVVKIALIASIILMGYNISEFVASYNVVSEKASQFLQMAKDNAASDADLRRSNLLLSSVLSIGYSVLIYFSDIVIWLVAIVVSKLIITLLLSDKVLIQILHDRTLSQKSFLVSKYDAFFNAVMGLAFALVLVL